jgi:hypothetical protein
LLAANSSQIETVFQTTPTKKPSKDGIFAFSLLTAHPFQTAATLTGAGLVIN